MLLRRKSKYVYPSSPEALPNYLVGKTTKDVHPRDAMKYFPKRRAWGDAWRYILLSLGSESLHIKTPDYLIDQVREKIVGYLHEVNHNNPHRLEADMRGFDEEVWPVLKDTMKTNYGMTKMVYDYAYRSRFLPRAILVGAQAVLLELFHSGRTRSISGEFEYIPYDDAMIEMIVWEPISLVMRERNEFSQRNVLNMYHQIKAGNPDQKVNMLSCGAGLLPLLRTNDFPKLSDFRVTAIDMDVRNLENLKLVYDEPIEQRNVDYLIMDAVEFCNAPENYGKFPIVEALGLLSYNRWHGETKEMIRTLLRSISTGGILICDLQLMNPHLLRCAYSMGWKSNLFPDWCAYTAIRRMRKICRQLGVRMQYERSKHLKHAAGVNFVLYKPAMRSHRG